MSGNHSFGNRARSERGVALIMTMLVMALMAALMIGFSSVVASDQRYRYIDRDRVRAFYAAQSGLEKLSADLANLFYENVAPTPQQIADLGTNPPEVPDVTFTTGVEGGLSYGVTYIPPEPGETEWNNISSGPYEGLIALKKRYWLDSAVRTTAGGESHLRRKIETVSIPVFQFGIFSDVDLSFSAADTFDFRGRVHTNSNLFLAQGGTTCLPSPCTLWLRDRVTAVKQIVRQRLSNGVSITDSGSTQRVRVATSANGATGQAFRDLARTEGSVVDGVGSAANTAWPTLSLSTYKGYLRTGKTGAKQLNLPLIKEDVGGANIDLIRRPNDGQEKSDLLAERYFSKVSLRILLSDTAQDILKLPTVTQTAPVSLEGDWTNAADRPAGYGPIDTAHPPVARSTGQGLGITSTQVNEGAHVQPGHVTAGTQRDIDLDAMPTYFRLPELTLRNAAGVAQVLDCTGKTATTFTGCTVVAGGIPVAGNVSTVSAMLDGVLVSTPVVNVALPVVTVAAGATQRFSPSTFWVVNGTDGPLASDNTNVLISCEGYTEAPAILRRCNVPAIPGAIAGTPSVVNNAIVTTGALTGAMSTLGGFIKIEMQDTNRAWRDVTLEILNWGFGGPNLNPARNNIGRVCPDPTPNAIVRLQRLQENSETAGAACSYADVPRATYYVPNVLFDAREAIYRDAVPAGSQPRLGGVMHYVALDVANLSRWFQNAAPYGAGSGNQALTDGEGGGFSVYFSDRRNNRDLTNKETGEYGFEDVVNPTSATATPNNVLNAGEDMNASKTLETYGQFPSFNGTANSEPTGATGALDVAAARPWSEIRAPYAQVNRAVLFRRALKLINGGLGNIVAPGLTVAAENPIYIQGDWNATTQANNADPFLEPNVATSVAGDAVTLLSTDWNDNNSFSSPYLAPGRPRRNTSYRLAIISGKGPIFPQPAGTGATFGTDGGVHSFLRFLEGGASAWVNYRGSMATLYYHRQALSPFKCCGVAAGGIVYDVPRRRYEFDLDFLDPALLPPLTPMVRDRTPSASRRRRAQVNRQGSRRKAQGSRADPISTASP